MRRKIPELTEALIGRFDAHHALLVGQMLGRLDQVDAAVAAVDAQIVAATAPWARQLELLQTIPGVGLKTAQVFIAESGADMTAFPSAAHLAAWAGVAPAMHESAGRRTSAGSRHGNKRLTSMLVESAHAVARMPDTYLGAQSPASRPPGIETPPSRWAIRCWSAGITCCCATSPTAIWDRAGSTGATTPHRPDDWSPSSNAPQG